MSPKEKAIELSNDLKGIKNSDALIDNCTYLCLQVIDAIESVVGSQRWERSDHQNEVIKYWRDVYFECKDLKF